MLLKDSAKKTIKCLFMYCYQVACLSVLKLWGVSSQKSGLSVSFVIKKGSLTLFPLTVSNKPHLLSISVNRCSIIFKLCVTTDQFYFWRCLFFCFHFSLFDPPFFIFNMHCKSHFLLQYGILFSFCAKVVMLLLHVFTTTDIFLDHIYRGWLEEAGFTRAPNHRCPWWWGALRSVVWRWSAPNHDARSAPCCYDSALANRRKSLGKPRINICIKVFLS